MRLLKELSNQEQQDSLVHPDDPTADLPDIHDNSDEDLDISDENQDLPSDTEELNQIAAIATEPTDKQGVIRHVDNAHLIYKRKSPDGTYEELWMYKTTNSDLKNAMNLRKAVLAGTDISSTRQSSDDNSQNYKIWSAGNVEFVNIHGLPN